MQSAINILEVSLLTMETNELINRQEGNAEQADLEAVTAAEIRQALHVLIAVNFAKEPIWPKPR